MINYDAEIRYEANKEYTREEKEYFLARQAFDWITSDYSVNDNWIWNIVNNGMEDKGVKELTDAELEEEWLELKESKDEELEYKENNNE
jgi:hypothetical protein